MSVRQFDPDSLIPGTPTAGQPPRPSGVLPENAYEVEVIRSPDGTQTLNSASQISRYPEPLDPVPALQLAPRDAAMLGMARMLDGLTWTSTDLQEVFRSKAKKIQLAKHKLGRIFLDWPDTQKEAMPAQSCLITSAEPAAYNGRGFTNNLLTDTLDRYHPNTVLRYLGEQTIPLLLVFWCSHKDQRRGLEAAVGRLLAAEPQTNSGGRRILVPEYFSRLVRYTLVDSERPDAQDPARAGEWRLAFGVQAEVPHVELVWSPGHVEGSRVGVET